jgi:predicted unusual protein kinase regulating ubiquinone biosynthesis (AarF/ABC1/UbiB family)
MTTEADEPSSESDGPSREAGKLPTGRIGRTARVGGLVTGQGLRWAGMRTANRVRSPERAAAARNQRTGALVNELVDQLGQMRGAAMKVGQVLSMVEFEGLPEDERDALQAKLAELRDDVPSVPFSKLERLMQDEFGGPLSRVFSEFDEHALAAASIGQVHRATTIDGEDVAVKVQYPGVAEAVETDLRNAMLLLPLVKRLAPSLDAKALATELRERISEELDYELEAQHQRRIGRLRRDHPFISVPGVNTELSTRRVLVSEYVEGERFEAVRRLPEAQRDEYGEIVFRFYFGLLYRDRIALGDPHPGNQLLRPDGRVGFLDYGMLRDVSTSRADAERGIARSVRAGDAGGLKSALVAGAYLSPAGAELVDDEVALKMVRRATRWYAVPGFRRFSGEQGRRDRGSRNHGDGEHAATAEAEPVAQADRQDEARDQLGQFTLPAETILIRRMHAIVGAELGQLRAGADWGAIAAEYLHGEPPSTPLGEAEAEYFVRRTGASGAD